MTAVNCEWAEAQRLVGASHGLVALTRQNVAPAFEAVGIGVVRVQFEGLVELRLRQLEIRLRQLISHRQVDARLLPVRRELDGLPEQRDRREVVELLEVRESARNLKASQEGIESATRSLTSANEQLRAERIRLEYGESTPFDVLQREEQFVEAEVGLIDAYRAYRVSATSLDRNQGTILRNRNIKIEEAARLR